MYKTMRLLPPSPNHCTLNEQCLAIFTTNVVNADRRGPLNARLIETRTTASSPIGQSTRAALLKQPTLTRGETS
ncbi:putative lipo domain protein [Burkholderia pseudomallei MSHR5569]|nr:putative lipo domain protein [Burkholderia pseudomallei MSHR5569]